MTGSLERYRSGHNEAVLKTVCPQGRVGSNPTLSAADGFYDLPAELNKWCDAFKTEAHTGISQAEVPKRLKGLPWKGSRSLVAARGFKSLLLRSAYDILDETDCPMWKCPVP